MAGVQIQSDGLKSLNHSINQMAGLISPPNDLLAVVGAVVESQTRRRILEEKAAPDGSIWDDWSDKYAATRHSGHSFLEGDGDLVDSLGWNISDNKVSVGSNLVYAAIQQFGGDEVGINIPARAFLGLSADNEKELIDVVEAFIANEIRDMA